MFYADIPLSHILFCRKAERHKTHLHQSPVRFGKWYPDYCYGKDDGQQEMHYGDLPPSTKNPQHGEYYWKAPCIVISGDLLAERGEGQNSNLHQLHSEWNADNSDTQQDSRRKVHQGDNETTQHEPKDITKSAQ